MDYQPQLEEIDLNSENPDLQQSSATSQCLTNFQYQEIKKDNRNSSSESTSSFCSSPERDNIQNEEFLKPNSSDIFGEHLFKEFNINSSLVVDDDKNCPVSNIPESELEKIPLVKKLKEENQLLKRKIKFLTQGYRHLENQALCNIAWQNISFEARHDIEELIKKASSEGQKTKEDVNSQHDNSVKDAVGLFKPRPGYLGNTQYYPLFAVDTSVYPVDVTKTNVKYFEVPFYERRLHDPLPLPPERVIREQRTKCFNCGSPDHNYTTCPLPRNPEVIAMHRREWQLTMDALRTQPVIEHRYFQQEDSTSEGMIPYRQFKPGVLSPKLREALGLEEGQYPPYYERMLKFGYPPGYLAREETPSEYEEEDPPLKIYNTPEDYERKTNESLTSKSHDNSSLIKKQTLPPYKKPYTPTVIYPGLDFKGYYGGAVEKLSQQFEGGVHIHSSTSSTHSVYPMADITFEDDQMIVDKEPTSHSLSSFRRSPSPSFKKRKRSPSPTSRNIENDTHDDRRSYRDTWTTNKDTHREKERHHHHHHHHEDSDSRSSYKRTGTRHYN